MIFVTNFGQASLEVLLNTCLYVTNSQDRMFFNAILKKFYIKLYRNPLENISHTHA